MRIDKETRDALDLPKRVRFTEGIFVEERGRVVLKLFFENPDTGRKWAWTCPEGELREVVQR